MRIRFKKPEDVESFLPMVDEAALRSSSWIRYIGSSPSQFSCSRGIYTWGSCTVLGCSHALCPREGRLHGSVFHFRESDYSSSVCYDQVLSKYKAGCTMLVAVNFMNWVKVTYVSEWVFIRRDFSFFRKLYDLLPSTIQGTVRTV